MKHLTLRYRLLALTLLPSALIAIVLVLYFTLSGIHTLEGDLRAKGVAIVRYLAPISEYGIISGQIESLHSLAQTTLQEPGVKAAIIVNQRGRAIAVSGRVSLGAEVFRADLSGASQVAESDQWIAFGAPVFRSINDADTLFDPNGSKESSKTEVIGRVFVEFDKTELANRQRDLMHRGLAIVLVGLLLLAALAIAMADNLARPVMRLVRAVREMSSGKFETRVRSTSSGELGALEQGFNEMAGQIQDIHQSMQTRIEEATAQLAFQARHDPLTGLLNRREFEHRLERALLNIQAGGDEVTALFIDLDRFKPVNDICGHLAGDELLRQISQLFQGRLREEDTLARLGGDEFGIILAECTGQRARQVAEDLCGLASAYRFIWQDKVFSIGASIGLTPVNRRVRNITEIIAAGDAACFRAKDSGRNQVCEQDALNTPERRKEVSNWAARIANALAENRLAIEAIPLHTLHDKGATPHIAQLSAQLLEPGRPPVSHAALIDAAERYDLGPSIDLRLVETAVAAMLRSQRLQKPLLLLIPVSGATLSDRKIIDYLIQALASQSLGGSGLCFVFSEDIASHQSRQALDFSQQVKSLGCQIGLDDFGGGLSSFALLRSIGPRFAKPSRSLTRDLSGNRASTALLRAIQEITDDLDIHTIADGIDNNTLLDQIATLKISYAQGKAIAPAEPFEVWLEGAVFR